MQLPCSPEELEARTFADTSSSGSASTVVALSSYFVGCLACRQRLLTLQHLRRRGCHAGVRTEGGPQRHCPSGRRPQQRERLRFKACARTSRLRCGTTECTNAASAVALSASSVTSCAVPKTMTLRYLRQKGHGQRMDAGSILWLAHASASSVTMRWTAQSARVLWLGSEQLGYLGTGPFSGITTLPIQHWLQKTYW